MSVITIGAQVLTTYKADVGPHKRELRKLTGAERAAQKEIISGLDKRNVAYQKQIAMLGKVTIAVGAVGAAFIAAKASFNTFAKDIELQAGARGRDINSLKQATKGLLTEQQLLTIAATANSARFRVNNEQMKLMAQTMLVLRKDNIDLAESFVEVQKAVTEANSEGLKKFGFETKAAGGTVEAFNEIMGEMQKKMDEFGGSFELAGDDVRRSGVEMSDTMRDLKKDFGALVNEAGPLINALVKIGGTFLRTAKNVFLYASGIKAAMFLSEETSLGGTSDLGAQGVAAERAHRLDVARKAASANLLARSRALQAERRKRQQQQAEREKHFKKKKRGAHVPRFGERLVDAAFAARTEGFIANAEGGGFVEPLGLQGAGGFGGIAGLGGGRPSDPQGRQAPAGAGQEAQARAAIQGSEAFTIFQQAATASFNAVITGSQSMSTAFREAAGSMIAAKASQLFAEGVFQTAMVAASFFSPISAGKHVQAAAIAFAGAAALGVLAKTLGFTGTTGGGSGARGGAGAGGGGAAGAGGQGSSKTIIIGGDFETDSRRRRQAKLRAVLKRAEGSEGSDSTVSFD